MFRTNNILQEKKSLQTPIVDHTKSDYCEKMSEIPTVIEEPIRVLSFVKQHMQLIEKLVSFFNSI